MQYILAIIVALFFLLRGKAPAPTRAGGPTTDASGGNADPKASKVNDGKSAVAQLTKLKAFVDAPVDPDMERAAVFGVPEVGTLALQLFTMRAIEQIGFASAIHAVDVDLQTAYGHLYQNKSEAELGKVFDAMPAQLHDALDNFTERDATIREYVKQTGGLPDGGWGDWTAKQRAIFTRWTLVNTGVLNG